MSVVLSMRNITDSITKRGFAALNGIVRPVVQAGIGNPLPIGAGAVALETTGRRSGLPRTVPLLATRLGDTLTVSTVRTDSQWLRNIEADENVRGLARRHAARRHRHGHARHPQHGPSRPVDRPPDRCQQRESTGRSLSPP